MRIVVTGAAGQVGDYVVRELVPDHQVSGFDLRLPVDPVPGVAYIRGDHTDLGQVYGALARADTVVHLSALARPQQYPPEVVFGRNVVGTHNVAEAAATFGVKVVYASTINTLGFGYRTRHLTPVYLPVDELHPNRPQDSYSLSKLVGEHILETVHRRTGIGAISIRPAWVIHPARYPRLIEQVKDPASCAWSLWSYIDVRDLARSFRLAVEDHLLGFESIFVCAADAASADPLCDVFPRFYPGTEEMAAGLTGRQPAVSIDKARRLLGYEPQHSWVDQHCV